MTGYQLVIRPRSGWRLLDWREVYAYRDLFFFLTWRSIRVRYAQSALGVGWAVMQPVVTMIVFTVVFGRLAGVASDGAPYAAFSMAALVPWTFFSAALTQATGSTVSGASLISKVYFPRVILPISAVLSKLVDFGIALLLLFLLLAAYGIAPNAGVLVLPLLVMLMVLSAAGIGMWLTALAIQYRDVQHAMGFLTQMLMYAAPVVYPASLVPERYQMLYALNPMVGVIEGFRAALLGTRAMPWDLIAVGGLSALALLVTGTLYFLRKERVFADVA